MAKYYGFVSIALYTLYLYTSNHLWINPSIAVPAQGHAGVFGCLSAGEDLVIAHSGHLVLRVKDLQSTDLQDSKSFQLRRVPQLI